MNLLPIYRDIRLKLQCLGPVYRYLGQYLPGAGNTVYRAPALYIELPRPVQVNHYPGGIQATRDTLTIHVLTHHLYKHGEGQAADEADDAHTAKCLQVQKLLDGYHVATNGGLRLLTQQLILAGADVLRHQNGFIITQIRYSTELYAYP